MQIEPSENITWTPCFQTHFCARLSLPLDHSNPSPSGLHTEIALLLRPSPLKPTNLRSSSSSQPKTKNILVNPGGPGSSGTTFLLNRGAHLHSIVGPEFDLLGFDPRGVGASTPLARCFGSDEE